MRYFISVIVFILIGAGAYFFMFEPDKSAEQKQMEEASAKSDGEIKEVQKKVGSLSEGDTFNPVIGTSVEGRAIRAYQYGTGAQEILLVGGIHGGYSWNTALLAYEAMDYFTAHPEAIPENMRVTIVPVLNPDGLYKITGTTERFEASDMVNQTDASAGRFNAHEVDLNRNFDCNWSAQGVWQNKSVSGGTRAFSEPESATIKTYIEKVHPQAVLVWYSAAGGVYGSSCGGAVPVATKTLLETYAHASGYPSYDSFDAYETSGDMVNWLARKEIPAISILLSDHSNTEWEKNKAGIIAVLNQYAK